MTGRDASTRRPRATAVRRASLWTAVAFSLLAGLPVAMAGSGHAERHASGGVVAADRFRPTLVRPGYQGTSANPYATHLGLVVDQKSRLLFTLDADPRASQLSPTYVGAYRLSDLRPAAAHGSMLGGWVSTHLVDPQRAGMTVAVSTGGVNAPTTSVERIVAVHGVPRATDVTAVSLGSGQVVVGLADGPQPDLVFALSVAHQSKPLTNTAEWLPGTVQLSLIRLGHPGTIWVDRLQDCLLPVFGQVRQLAAPIGYVPSRHAVDIGCVPPPKYALGGTGPHPPLPGGIGVINVGSDFRRAPTEFILVPIPGETSAQAAGVWVPKVNRLALQVYSSGGSTWFVFDGRHGAWVGSVKLAPIPPLGGGAGLDAEHSRLYIINGSAGSSYGGGLVLSDVAPTPVDVGHAYPEFDVDPAPPGKPPLDVPIAIDPASGQVFITYADSPTILVAHDKVPYYTPPTAANPDANTTDVQERAGVTGSTYSGSAQGYGMIVRQVGGATNLVSNVTTSQPPLGPTRELDASYLDTLSLGQTGSQARAIAAQPDDTTSQQLPRQQVGSNTDTIGGWPFRPVACHSGDVNRKGWSADGAQVGCTDNTALAAIAAGSSSASYATGTGGESAAASSLVSVAGSTLSAASELNTKRGNVTTVTSVARGISLLGGMLRIGEVSTTAEAHAHGRPKTAGAAFSRTLRDVTLNGKTLCAADCDPSAVAEQVNAALTGHVLISFPTPDRLLAKGSPGGFQALVQRDLYGTVNEKTLNDQPPDRREVPGLEATIFEDNTVPSRTIVYLAGVEAEAHYGIYRLGLAGIGDAPGGPSTSTSASTPAGDASALPDGTTLTSAAGGVGTTPAVAPPTSVPALLHHGWQLLVAALSDATRLFGVWLVLLAPVYLSARRWLLTRRHETAHV